MKILTLVSRKASLGPWTIENIVGQKHQKNLPVVAMTSKPTNAKKQVAAAESTPSTPNGKKPPAPQPSLLSQHSADTDSRSLLSNRAPQIVAFGRCFVDWAQLSTLRLKMPIMQTNESTQTLTRVNSFVTVADSFTPTARITVTKRQHLHLKQQYKNSNPFGLNITHGTLVNLSIFFVITEDTCTTPSYVSFAW